MARPKLSEFLKSARREVDGLSGLDRTLVDPLLVEADALRGFVEDLRLMVKEGGPMIEKEVGTVNNRHIELVENPALTAYSRNVGRLGDILKKVSSLSKSMPEKEEKKAVDPFDAFNS